jgi:hypothetical protein
LPPSVNKTTWCFLNGTVSAQHIIWATCVCTLHNFGTAKPMLVSHQISPTVYILPAQYTSLRSTKYYHSIYPLLSLPRGQFLIFLIHFQINDHSLLCGWCGYMKEEHAFTSSWRLLDNWKQVNILVVLSIKDTDTIRISMLLTHRKKYIILFQHFIIVN